MTCQYLFFFSIVPHLETTKLSSLRLNYLQPSLKVHFLDYQQPLYYSSLSVLENTFGFIVSSLQQWQSSAEGGSWICFAFNQTFPVLYIWVVKCNTPFQHPPNLHHSTHHQLVTDIVLFFFPECLRHVHNFDVPLTKSNIYLQVRVSWIQCSVLCIK